MSEVYWAPDWACWDCGKKVPIEPGQDTRPIAEAHECDSADVRVRQSELAAYESGYRVRARESQRRTRAGRPSRVRNRVGWPSATRPNRHRRQPGVRMSLPPSYWLDQIRAELARAKERVESACESCPFRACTSAVSQNADLRSGAGEGAS